MKILTVNSRVGNRIITNKIKRAHRKRHLEIAAALRDQANHYLNMIAEQSEISNEDRSFLRETADAYFLQAMEHENSKCVNLNHLDI